VRQQRAHPVRRRPRVAGRPRAGWGDTSGRPGPLAEHGTHPASVALDDPAPDLAEMATGQEAAASGRAAQHAGLFRWLTPIRGALVGVMLVALGAATWMHGQTHALVGSAATSNRALLDVGTTAQVSGQVRDAVQRIFSYDFARLDDNERAAAAVITGSFADDYRLQFARVRQLAPGQQAVVVATVPALAVKVLDGDRAILVVFIDQQANRGGQAQPLVAAGRLRVSAQRVRGSWKIAGVQPF
jgi:Mce-associated membrane protein